MVQGPGDELIDDGHQAFTHFCQRVFHPGRHFGIETAEDETVGFEAFQGLGQDFRGNVGDRAADRAEAGGTVLGEDAEYEDGPFAGEAGQDVPDGAGPDASKFFQIFLQWQAIHIQL